MGRRVKSLSNSSKALASTNSRCAVVKVQCRGFERRNAAMLRSNVAEFLPQSPSFTAQNGELDKEEKSARTKSKLFDIQKRGKK